MLSAGLVFLSDPDERDKCLSQIIFLEKMNIICKALNAASRIF